MADKTISVTIEEPKVAAGDIAFSYSRINGVHAVQMHKLDSSGRPVITSWAPSPAQIKAIKKALKWCIPEFKWRMILPDGNRFQTEAEKNAEEVALGDPGDP